MAWETLLRRPRALIEGLGSALRRILIHHPRAVVVAWVAVAAVLFAAAPDLTELAAEGQAHLVPEDSESAIGRKLVAMAWPDQAYESVAVVLLHRPGGLTDPDRAYARELARELEARPRPAPLLRVLGPEARPEIARYLRSADGTSQLVLAQLATSFVAPATQEAVGSLRAEASDLGPPPGLQVLWTGDAVFGRDYMANVQTSLDRAAIATVVLLMIVLLAVYRSVALALVPLATIGIGLVISRSLLAWMTQAGWAMSPLVELFLVVILFGCGTDFCLFLSWRFGEQWNPSNPGAAMQRTLDRATVPLLTSAGTVIAGLLLMGLTKFKLFSSTGPSVALGLALTLLATLTLTPALLLLLSRYYPRAFAGLTAPSSGFWDSVGRWVLARPFRVWLGTLALMAVPAGIGLSTWYVQDLVAEMPSNLESVRGIRQVARQYGAGRVAPLAVVIRSSLSLKSSEGLALVDDLSRMLTRQRRLREVRSATQPLGSPEPLEPARLGARIEAVVQGFDQMIGGANQLQDGLNQGAAKLRTAILLEEMTGLPLTGGTPGSTGSATTRESLMSGLYEASEAMLGTGRIAAGMNEPGSEKAATPKAAAPPAPGTVEPAPAPEGPRELLLTELTRAADGAGKIAAGARRAQTELSGILKDPVGQRALDRLLVNAETVRDYPDLARSFAAYLSPDGHLARIDLVQADRLFSPAALDQVEELRRQLRLWLREVEGFGPPPPGVVITGPNAESADIRALTTADQFQSWIVMPLGVFLVLLLALRDPLACANLVGTMVLTYAFALGVTHAVFVWGLGAEGIDWKVPYFLFVLLVAVGVDYNVFLMTRLQEEAAALGLRAGIIRAIAQTGGLISSAAAITACSFSAFLLSPLGSIRQLGFALVVGIVIDASLVRPVLVPCGQWLLRRRRDRRPRSLPAYSQAFAYSSLARGSEAEAGWSGRSAPSV